MEKLATIEGAVVGGAVWARARPGNNRAGKASRERRCIGCLQSNVII